VNHAGLVMDLFDEAELDLVAGHARRRTARPLPFNDGSTCLSRRTDVSPEGSPFGPSQIGGFTQGAQLSVYRCANRENHRSAHRKLGQER
jgi:hypothetical protein